MSYWQAAFLGLVEGLTEFLPVSSTGHLIIASRWLGLAQGEFLKSFEIAIQSGAILAVLTLYSSSVFKNPAILKRIFLAFLPTAVIGFALYPLIKKYLMGDFRIVLAALFVGGVFLIIFERLHREKDDALDDLSKIPISKALLIGVFQALAVIPCVSRSAATIVGGLFLGFKRKTIVELSFLLAIPTLLAATGLELVKHRNAFSSAELGVFAVGTVASFVTSVLSIKFFLRFIEKHDFTPFGLYRVVAAALFWFFL